MADDIILKLDGKPGESKIDGHKGEIDILGVSFGMSNGGSMAVGGGGGTGKVSFQDIHFTKPVDESSNALALACCMGEHIKEAKFTFRKQGAPAGQGDYLVVTLTDVLISSWNFGSHDHPENLSLNFAKIKYEYKPQDATGKLGAVKTFGWDVKAVKKY